MSVVELGPYRFSAGDVRWTLVDALRLIDEFGDDARPALAGRRARIAALLAGRDLPQASDEELAPLLAAVWPELRGARADLVDAALLPARRVGTVVQLSRSGGGLPKLPQEQVEVDFGGVVGDVQATRRHHGRPWQALCLWSDEVIAGFAAVGHPIGSGSAGENVTIAGLPWHELRPGARMAIGSVLCELSSWATPCAQNARWFSDREFRRIDVSQGPVSRVYAIVLEPGSITAGDTVVVEP